MVKKIELGPLPVLETQGQCQSCGRPIRWVRTAAGRPMPLEANAMVHDANGASPWVDASDTHWAHCPQAETHRKKNGAKKEHPKEETR